MFLFLFIQSKKKLNDYGYAYAALKFQQTLDVWDSLCCSSKLKNMILGCETNNYILVEI